MYMRIKQKRYGVKLYCFCFSIMVINSSIWYNIIKLLITKIQRIVLIIERGESMLPELIKNSDDEKRLEDYVEVNCLVEKLREGMNDIATGRTMNVDEGMEVIKERILGNQKKTG